MAPSPRAGRRAHSAAESGQKGRLAADRPYRGRLSGMDAGEAPARMSAAGNACRYAAYGLCIESEIVVPWLPTVPDTPDTPPDVTIRVGPAPASLPAPADRFGPWETAPGAFLLSVEGVARYLVTGGRDILVEPAGGDAHDVCIFLVGSVLAACLQQRGVLTLHASAVETAAGAVLFSGVSGAGKSTLLCAMLDRGYAMLADDVTGIVAGPGGRPVALPAFPWSRLWADAVDALRARPRIGARVRPDIEKYLIRTDRFRAAPLAVEAGYFLTGHNRDTIGLERLRSGDALERILLLTYRKRFLHGLGLGPAHFRAAAALARRMRATLVRRPLHPFSVGALADRIEQDLAQTPRDGAGGDGVEAG